MDAEQAIQSFWSSFTLPAYDENSVPDDAVMPYITYSVEYDSFDNNVSLSASLWYQSTSWAAITAKAHEIRNYISMGGVTVKTDNGAVWIKRGSPFYQRLGDVEKDVKRIYFNVEAEYIEGGR